MLILKVDYPEMLKEFRPIDLCNVIYKIITKIITTRLKRHMDFLVVPNQCNFVLGRHSSENIVIVHEVIHSMRRKKGKKGSFAIKVDVEKAYDRLEWSFQRDTLGEVGFNDPFCSLIMHCVGSTFMQALWNREKNEGV